MLALIHRSRSLVLVVGLFLSCIATSALVSWWRTAGAQGIPAVDPLWYSGTLADSSGKALTGSFTIDVDLYAAATGGTAICSTTGKSVTLATQDQGRFRVAMNSACVAAIQANPELWVDVKVNGTSMGRTKVGAVPYAVEAQRVAEPDCPPGYTHDTTATSITLCKRGKDEMVKVGDFWVDRYEASLVDTTTWKGGRCDGSGKPYGASSDDYDPAGFPDWGKATTKLYACSKSGNKPSASMTWFQAAAACAFSGKHLCTNGEWQVAALGTPDDSSSCNISTSAPENAGNRAACISQNGAMDMVGNLWEWVDLWGQAGKVDTSYSGQSAAPWPSGYGDGKDLTANVNGEAHNGSVYQTGIPAAAFRGGGFSYGTSAGVFELSLNHGPSYSSTSYGARCCRR